METFGERIHRLRSDLKGRPSQRTLAEMAGISNATISNWENDKVEPSSIGDKYLIPLAKVLKVSVAYLKTGTEENPNLGLEPIHVVDEEEEIGEDDVHLTVCDVVFQAGPGAPAPSFIATKEKLTFKRSWLRKKGVKESNVRIVSVGGKSMQPTIWEGDRVAVDISKKRPVDGKVFALAYGDELRMKRLFWTADGKLRIVSDNPEEKEEVLSGEEINRVHICGQVFHKMGDGGL